MDVQKYLAETIYFHIGQGFWGIIDKFAALLI
jgi:hypothetical protein